MLRDLTIQGYRSFRNFQVENLANVNLVVGTNNSGKTSLLEAIYLLVNQNAPQCLAEILQNRGEISERYFSSRIASDVTRRINSYQINHIFYGHQSKPPQQVVISSKREQKLSTKIQVAKSERQLPLRSDDIEDNRASEYELVFGYGTSTSPVGIPIREDGAIEIRSFRILPKDSNNHRFLTTENLDFSDLAELWDGIILTPKEEKIVEALKILEPSVERISFTSRQTSNTGILLKLKGQKEPIPLGSMGDGMRRILTLATSAVMAENGVLLVDEIDTGLYYRAQTDMWKTLIETSQRLRVQIFATTHSLDCVRAFQAALLQSSDPSLGLLFRLSLRDKTEIRPVLYTAHDLGIAIQQEIEVR